jgi:WD40 repeat protein
MKHGSSHFCSGTGHQAGRPLFGSRYCGAKEDLIISWSVDGSLCLWDAFSQGNINSPIAVLKQDDEYPIYAVEISKDCIAVGGGSEGGFVGIPLYLYSLSTMKRGDVVKDVSQEDDVKKEKADKTEKTSDDLQQPEPPSKPESKDSQSETKEENSPPPDKKPKTGDGSDDDKAAKGDS